MNTPVTEQEAMNWVRGTLAVLCERGWTVEEIDREVGDRTGKDCRDVLRRLLDAETRPLHQSEAITAPAAAGADGVKGKATPSPASATATPERANLEAVAETVGVAGPELARDVPSGATSGGGEIGQTSHLAKPVRRRSATRKRWAGLTSVQVRVRVNGEFADALLAMSPKARARAVAHLLCGGRLGIDLKALGSYELRCELARANANVNQALRHYHFGDGDGDLVVRLREVCAVLDALRHAGAMNV